MVLTENCGHELPGARRKAKCTGRQDLEVDAIQACGGQKSADGSRLKYGGGILWSILKTCDPNFFKQIMKKRKFENKFKQPDLMKAANHNKQMCSTAGGDAADAEPIVQKDGT